MSQAADLPAIDAGIEQRLVGFDFSASLDENVELNPGTVTIVCQAHSGRDPLARARILGQFSLAPGATGRPNTQVNQLFGTFVGGVVYLVQCYAGDTSDGQELSIWALWPCQIPGQAAPVPPPPTGRYSY